jgi:hypothetical protein
MSFASSSFATSLKTRSRILAGCTIAALAVAVTTQSAAAASTVKAHKVHRVYHAYAANHGYLVNRAYPAYGGYRFDPRNPEAYGYVTPPPHSIVGPNYVFVPGAGILGESCDLPTSTCSNEYRDVQ